VYPAACNGLYGLTVRDVISTQGVQGISGSFDGVGLQARGPGDLRMLLDVLAESKEKAVGEGKDGKNDGMKGEKGLEGLKIGVLDIGWGVYPAKDGGKGKWDDDDVVSHFHPCFKSSTDGFKGLLTQHRKPPTNQPSRGSDLTEPRSSICSSHRHPRSPNSLART
jgi:hypothetical protein